MLKIVRHAIKILIAVAVFAGLTTAPALAQQGRLKNQPPVGTAKPGEVVARFPATLSRSDVDKMADDAGCVVTREIPFSPGYYVLTVKSRSRAVVTRDHGPYSQPSAEVMVAVAKLMAKPGVLANPNYYIQYFGAARHRAAAPPAFAPNDPLYSNQLWHMSMINMPQAWAIQSNAIGKPIVVADSDTGFDVTHPEFPAARVVSPVDVTVTPTATATHDGVGHGTYTAGLIIAATNNGVGVTGTAGLTNGGVNVQIMPIKMFADDGTSTGADSVAAINYSIQQKADVHNMSWGSNGSFPTLQSAINDALATGMILVAAAGNDGTTAGDAIPSTYPGVIRVTAVGTDRKLSPFSSFGPRVAIAAPGGDGIEVNGSTNVWSTFPLAGASDDPTNTTGYVGFDGTSASAPQVSGVCALLLEAGAAKADVRAAIQGTAQQLDETPVLDPNGFSKYGAGLLDAYAALQLYLAPVFQAQFLGAVDLGPTYYATIPPFRVQVRQVNAAPPVGGITLEIQTSTFPVSVVRTLVDGTDFTVPRSIPAGQSPATWINIQVPDPTKASVTLAPGRYKAVMKASGTELASQFFEVVAQTQPRGRSMFAAPFKIRQADPTTYPNAASQPERTLFGDAAVYSLARFNTLRLPSDFDYAIFQSDANGRRDQAGSFSAVAPDGSPLVYETTDTATSIAPVGLGYWLDLTSDVILNAIGPAAFNPVAIRLFAANGGWNMVGAPFTAPSAWGALSLIAGGKTYDLGDAITKGIISSALIGYRNGDYVYNIFPNGQMDPFNGYWVRVFQDCTLLVAPTGTTRSVPAAVATRAAATASLPQIDGWRARIIATVSGDRDGQNYFGQVKGASDDADRYDIPKPPSGGGHAYVRFSSTDKTGRSVSNAFDMRPLEPNQKVEWTAAVSTDRTNADVVLTWDGIGGVPRRDRVVLTDTVTGQTVDMRARSSYTFHSGEAGSTRMLKVTLSPGLSAGPLAITNVTVVSGRSATDTGLSVRFSTTADSDIVGVVRALNGTVVSNLQGAGRAAATGPTTLRWDGRSRSGAMLPPGPYLIEITARAADGQTATFRQPVQSLR